MRKFMNKFSSVVTLINAKSKAKKKKLIHYHHFQKFTQCNLS